MEKGEKGGAGGGMVLLFSVIRARSKSTKSLSAQTASIDLGNSVSFASPFL